MARYLLVANQTLGGGHLMEEVRRRIAAGPSSFYVLVPNTHPDTYPVDILWMVRTTAVDPSTPEAEHRAILTAQARLHQALDMLRAEGVEAQGDLGDPDPLTAIGVALAEEHFDEIIISTLPAGASRWLRMDLPHQAERKFKLPVTTVTAKG
jgi:GABA permease